jgi:hypothetical protein
MEKWRLEEGGRNTTELPIIEEITQLCDFRGYDADVLMKETAKLRKSN